MELKEALIRGHLKVRIQEVELGSSKWKECFGLIFISLVYNIQSIFSTNRKINTLELYWLFNT